MKQHLILAAAAAAAAITLSSCGSGTGEDLSEAARPQSLDGIVIVVDGIRFEFIRNRGSALATNPGDVETGTFTYSPAGNQIRQYPNRQGDNSNVIWPDDITGQTYTYQMINKDAGIVTLQGFAVNDDDFTGDLNTFSPSQMLLFTTDSNLVPNNQVQLDLTFETVASGQFVELTAISDMRTPGTTAPEFDIVRVPTRAQLSGFLGGGQIPFNFIPEDDATRPSRIVPVSLNSTTIQFTNGAADTTLDFSIQFVREAVETGFEEEEPTEIGTGIMFIDNVPLVDAIDYTWKRILGTDTATLVIEQSGTTLDGSYVLDFVGIDIGTYTGELDGNTVDINDVVGTFFIPGAVAP